MKYDVLVLGAGMVGLGAALHLQQRGRSVVLADRRGVAEETSFGNAGLIQREGILPYSFPRDLKKIIQYATNQLPEANLHWRALPWLLPYVYQYWRHGTPERIEATARAMRPLAERCIIEHEALMQAAGAMHLVRRTGYLRVFRSPERLDEAVAADEAARGPYGVTFEVKTPAEIAELEPHLSGDLAGAILMPQPVSVPDPGALGQAYGRLFTDRGGAIVKADAATLERVRQSWRIVPGGGEAIEAQEVVIALGPWSREIARRLGVHLPMGWKRGYHMHYRAKGNAVLNRPVIDADTGYCLATMSGGIRLTTGAEFARLDARKTPVQLARVEPVARTLFPLGERLDAEPWLGARPCFPDLVPMVGPVPGHKGLWINTGHHHLGFTLGPATGRLLAQLMTGEAPFTDPTPYRVGRFG